MRKNLILLRHGQSQWNKENLFTGWYDSPLSDQGLLEATEAGKLIVASKLIPEVIHTSTLTRATQTTDKVLDEIQRIIKNKKIPVHQSWRLNERHYGNLTGLNKKAAVADFGKEQVFAWRRKYSQRPPEITEANPYAASIKAQNLDLDKSFLPKAECLADVLDRLMPYWEEVLIPDLKKHDTILISAHGNSLRALIKFLDEMGEDEISALNIPTGIPLVYELNENLRPLKDIPVEDRYMGDAAVAQKAAAEVKNQT